jgi:hypothetical protein
MSFSEEKPKITFACGDVQHGRIRGFEGEFGGWGIKKARGNRGLFLWVENAGQ